MLHLRQLPPNMRSRSCAKLRTRPIIKSVRPVRAVLEVPLLSVSRWRRYTLCLGLPKRCQGSVQAVHQFDGRRWRER
jgi:hypothetical protein